MQKPRVCNALQIWFLAGVTEYISHSVSAKHPLTPELESTVPCRRNVFILPHRIYCQIYLSSWQQSGRLRLTSVALIGYVILCPNTNNVWWSQDRAVSVASAIVVVIYGSQFMPLHLFIFKNLWFTFSPRYVVNPSTLVEQGEFQVLPHIQCQNFHRGWRVGEEVVETALDFKY